MNREALDQTCERAILGCVLAILILGPLAFGAVDPVPFLIIQGLAVLCLLFWFARFWLNPKLRLLWPAVCWAVVAFTLYPLVRYLTADIEYVTRQEFLRARVYTALFFVILTDLYWQEPTRLLTSTCLPL